MKIIQGIEERVLRGIGIFTARHEWRFRQVEKRIERLVERKAMRAFDWIMPPWKRGKVLTRYVEPDTQPQKDIH